MSDLRTLVVEAVEPARFRVIVTHETGGAIMPDTTTTQQDMPEIVALGRIGVEPRCRGGEGVVRIGKGHLRKEGLIALRCGFRERDCVFADIRGRPAFGRDARAPSLRCGHFGVRKGVLWPDIRVGFGQAPCKPAAIRPTDIIAMPRTKRIFVKAIERCRYLMLWVGPTGRVLLFIAFPGAGVLCILQVACGGPFARRRGIAQHRRTIREILQM